MRIAAFCLFKSLNRLISILLSTSNFIKERLAVVKLVFDMLWFLRCIAGLVIGYEVMTKNDLFTLVCFIFRDLIDHGILTYSPITNHNYLISSCVL
jgi:hypothetical protein